MMMMLRGVCLFVAHVGNRAALLALRTTPPPSPHQKKTSKQQRHSTRARAHNTHAHARAAPFYLPAERLEKRGRAHDAVADVAGGRELGLERELGRLKLEQRLLHADRAQQHKVRRARRARGVEAVFGRRVVDRPAVLLAA